MKRRFKPPTDARLRSRSLNYLNARGRTLGALSAAVTRSDSGGCSFGCAACYTAAISGQPELEGLLAAGDKLTLKKRRQDAIIG